MDILPGDFFQQVLVQFKQTSLLEWVGVISAFICIYLAAKEHILNWPVSIISAGVYAVVYYQYKLYGDSFLQLYFVSTAIYGWYYWLKRKRHHEEPIVSFGLKGWLLTFSSVVVLTILLSLFLDNYTNTDVPYADGFCTAMSFVAQFLMTRKILQNWILWIIVDICYVPLLLYKGLASTAVLYAVLIVLAIIGYLDWRKTWKAAP